MQGAQETQVQSLGQEDPPEKEMATCSSVLGWRIPGTGEPEGLPSLGSPKKVLDLARYVPRDRVMLETDSPYIGTAKVRPPFVRPAQVMEVAEAYSQATGLTLKKVENFTDKNAARFFVI